MIAPTDEETRAVVETFRDLAPANIARGLLEARGIDATLQGDQLIGIAWHLSNAVGGVKLLVPQAQREEAQKILADSIAANESALADEALGDGPSSGDSKDADDGDGKTESAGDRAQPGPGDALAESAWKASLLGLLIAPPVLHLWSIHLLRQMRLAGGAKSSRGKTVASRAAITNFIVLSAASALLLRWLADRS